jgi:hypothetical protein
MLENEMDPVRVLSWLCSKGNGDDGAAFEQCPGTTAGIWDNTGDRPKAKLV